MGIADLIKKQTTGIDMTNTIDEDYGECPECDDGVLVERENYKTQETFLGCSNYPDCDHTEEFGRFDR